MDSSRDKIMENACFVCKKPITNGPDGKLGFTCILCGNIFHQTCGFGISHPDGVGSTPICQDCADLIPDAEAY